MARRYPQPFQGHREFRQRLPEQLPNGPFGDSEDLRDLPDLESVIRAQPERELLPFGDPRKLPPGNLARRLGIFSEYVEDGSYVKLREVAATYTLNPGWVTRHFSDGIDLTLSGRNLAVWTDYSGIDPEVNFFGQNPGRTGGSAADRGFDFASYPIPRTWSLSARFTY